MSTASKLAIWRLSVFVAGALIGTSLWLTFEVAQEISFWAGVADFVGSPEAMQWGNITLLFVGLCGFGLVLPALYIRWAWRRAFPRFAH